MLFSAPLPMLKVLATLGPSSANEEVVKVLVKEDIYLFSIYLPHTPLDKVEDFIKKVRSWIDASISLDSEGAQIKNQYIQSGSVFTPLVRAQKYIMKKSLAIVIIFFFRHRMFPSI